MDFTLCFSYKLSLNLKFLLEETAMEETLATSLLLARLKPELAHSFTQKVFFMNQYYYKGGRSPVSEANSY